MKLLYFAWIRERLDMPEEEVDIPANIRTVADLMAWQKGRGEQFASAFEFDRQVRVAINQEHVDDRDATIAGAREIAFFPPMTGG